MQLGAVDIPTHAAVRLLNWYRDNLPAELPHVVTRLEAAGGPLAGFETVTVPVNRDRRTGRYKPHSTAWRRRHGLSGLGQEEEAEETRAWWQRGLDAIKSLGSTALEVWGTYELREYADDADQKAAQRQYEAELAEARRQAELAAARAQEAQARAEYERQLAEIDAAAKAAKLKAYLPWVLGAAAVLGVVWAMRR